MCTRSLSGDEEACGSGGPHHQVGALSYILSFCCFYLSASASHRHQLTPSRSLMCHQAHIYTGKFSCTNTHTLKVYSHSVSIQALTVNSQQCLWPPLELSFIIICLCFHVNNSFLNLQIFTWV